MSYSDVKEHAMPTADAIQRALDIQQRAYRFVDWLRGVRQGEGIRLDGGHVGEGDRNIFDLASSWLAYNQEMVPESLMPGDDTRDAFVSMLVSFEMTSGEYDSAYYARKYAMWSASDEGELRTVEYCECKFCDGLVWRLGNFACHLTTESRRGAQLLKRSALRELINESQLPLVEGDLDALLNQQGDFQKELAVWTYAWELVRRCDFEANWIAHQHLEGAALILWRQVSAAKKSEAGLKFVLTAERVFAARERLIDGLQDSVDRQLG